MSSFDEKHKVASEQYFAAVYLLAATNLAFAKKLNSDLSQLEANDLKIAIDNAQTLKKLLFNR